MIEHLIPYCCQNMILYFPSTLLNYWNYDVMHVVAHAYVYGFYIPVGNDIIE